MSNEKQQPGGRWPLVVATAAITLAAAVTIAALAGRLGPRGNASAPSLPAAPAPGEPAPGPVAPAVERIPAEEAAVIRAPELISYRPDHEHRHDEADDEDEHEDEDHEDDHESHD